MSHTVSTPFGDVELLEGERILSLTPAAPSLPATLPDPDVEVMRITGVDRIQDVGQLHPPVASLSLPGAPGNDSVHFRLFEVVFGRDSQIIARALEGRFPGTMLTTLRYLAERQGLPPGAAPEPSLYAAREEEDGRVPHEVRDPSVDPIARQKQDQEGWGWPFFGSDDATVLFARNLAELAVRDPAILNQSITQRDGMTRTLGEALARAARWMERRSANPEGLVESRRPAHRSGAGILPAYPVWQDSPDSCPRPDGSLATGPLALAEVQAAAFDAWMALAAVAVADPAGSRRLGLGEASALAARADRVRASVLGNFVIRDRRGLRIAYATERRKDRPVPLDVRKSNPGHLLDSGILVGRDCRGVVRGLVTQMLDPAAGMVCRSGLRTMAIRERLFRPGAYHNGTVWLWENHAIANGLRRHGFPRLGGWLDGRVERTCRLLRHYPEYVRGDDTPEPTENRAVVVIESHDPTFGAWRNRVQQPGQLIQGWSLSAFVEIAFQLGRPGIGPVGDAADRALDQRISRRLETMSQGPPGIDRSGVAA